MYCSFGQSLKTTCSRWLGNTEFGISQLGPPNSMAMPSEDRGCSCVAGAKNSSTCQCFALFSVAVNMMIGNGTNTLFWTDKRFMSISLVELPPSVV
jgi:hypothetical protein